MHNFQARVNKCIELSEDREIIQATERDSLTSLFNMGYFFRYAKMFDQHSWESPMDAVAMEVNNYSVLHERYGETNAEKVLRRIGERLRRLARELGGVGSRQGEDTFLVYCPHQEDYSQLLNRLSENAT